MTAGASLASLQARLGRINLSRRERILILSVLGIAAIFWAISGLETAQSAKFAAEQARSAILSEQGKAAMLNAPASQTRITEEAGKVRAWSLMEPTIYMAQMVAQGHLDEFSAAAGISNRQISSDVPNASETGVQSLMLTLEGDFSWPSFLRLLELMEVSEVSIIPSSISVSSAAAATPRFEMTVRMPYVAPGAQP